MTFKTFKQIALIVVGICLYANAAKSQAILPYEAIENRIAKGGDTLFVLNFWATWCGPCIKELPYFDRIQTEYEKDKVRVLLLSLDFKSKYNSTLLPFIIKNNIQSEVILLDESNMDIFINRIDKTWSGAIPATLFFAKNEKLKFIEEELSYEDLKNSINQFNK